MEFPLYHHRTGQKRLRIYLNTNEITDTTPKTYPNPLLTALRYKHLLESPEIRSQTDLARKLGVSRARINQYLRLLKLPPEIRESVIQMGELSSPREVTERRLRGLLSSTQRE